jgi:hypothetical protein
MSMITMRGYVPKDNSPLSGGTKVFSRCGSWMPSTYSAKMTDDATQENLPFVVSCQAETADQAEEIDLMAS